MPTKDDQPTPASGTPPTPDPAPPGGTTDAPKPDPADSHSGAPPAKPGDPSTETKTYSPRQVSSIVAKKLREWEEEQDRKNAAAKEQADREAAEKAGQFQSLYEQERAAHKATRDRHSALEAEVEEYRDLLSRQLDTRIKDWPEEVTALDPGKISPDSATLKQRLAWADSVTPLVQRLASIAPPPGNWTPVTPPPGPPSQRDGATPSSEMEAYVQKRRARDPATF